MNKFDSYLLVASHYWSEHPTQRRGQAHFNILHAINPVVANRIRTTLADPFSDDSRMDAFLIVVSNLLEEP